MRNFDYLKQIEALRDLYQFCNAAEEVQQTDYDSCGWNCRKALEWLVRAIYKLKHEPIGERDNLYTLSTGKPFTELIEDDDKLMMACHYIRKVGNVAVHTGGIKEREAYYTLLNTYNLTGAILLRLGVLATLAPFNKDLIPKKPSPFIAPSTNVPEASKAFVESVPEENIKTPVKAAMPKDYSEAETRRMFIDLLLSEAGWEVLNIENAPMACKAGIEIYVEGMPNTKEEGYCDYVLYGKDCKPLAVVEAKRTSVEPEKGKHQAELYADCLEKKYGQRPVIYYTNGFRTMIIDGLGYPPRQVMGFHTLDDLELMISRRSRGKMYDLAIREEITNRDYQKMAIRSVCDHLNQMHRHGLIVMATGTGKTRVAISLCEVLLRNKWVKNILFLADRTALVRQANDSFTELLPDYTTCILTGAKDEEKNARLMFSTYQTMINYIDAEDKEFSVGRFDLIILDEAHRSIFGKYTAIFDYFDSFLVGLTATPRDEVDKSTFELFHLDGEPNFEYSMAEAVKEGHLVDYVPISRTTQRMREGIKYDSLTEEEKEDLDKVWEFEQMKRLLEKGEETPKTPRDIEKGELFKYIYNVKTVDIVIQSLMNEGLKIQSGNKIGKSIIFAYDHDHAKMIVDRFYELYPNFDPDFCQLVDYSVNYAQDLILKFKKRDKLPQIAVSVDMLDTGVDVPDILNLVFFKPVYSSIKYTQMVGRGTRLCPGIFDDGSDKKEFYIFDWCENFEYFKENKKGKVAASTITLAQRLFELKTDIAVILQHQKYQQEEFTKELCQQLKDELYEQVFDLNEKQINVRKVWDVVDKWKNKERWLYISELDALEMKQKLAPLMLVEDDNSGKLRFDALMLNIELSKLDSDVKATNSKNKVTRIAHVLQNKATIPAVQANMPLLLEVSNPKFWGSVTIDRLETVREALRELVYILMNDRIHGRFPIDVSDTYEGKDDVDKPVMYSDYRTRILDYLNEHRDLEVIQKIFHLEQLTIDDIKELEEICWKELGSKEEYEAYVNKGFMLCGDKVAVFIRSIIGVDRKIAKERFSKFLSDNVLNSLQEEYINQIIGYVCENGDITPMTIITNDNFEGIDKAFGVNMVSIKNYVEELHDVIVYQTGTGSVYVGRPHPVFEEEDHGLMAAEDRDLPE